MERVMISFHKSGLHKGFPRPRPPPSPPATCAEGATDVRSRATRKRGSLPSPTTTEVLTAIICPGSQMLFDEIQSGDLSD